MQIGSGDLLSLTGAVTLGLQHPLFLALMGIFAVGLASTAVAGERQRGTLEVLLARPISRRRLYVTLAFAVLVPIAFLVLMALEDVGALLRRRRRHVQLRFVPGSPEIDLSWVPGLADVVRKGDLLTCTLQGEVAPFLRAIAPAAVADLTLEPARLEEAFLEYYAGPEEDDGVSAR